MLPTAAGKLGTQWTQRLTWTPQKILTHKHVCTVHMTSFRRPLWYTNTLSAQMPGNIHIELEYFCRGMTFGMYWSPQACTLNYTPKAHWNPTPTPDALPLMPKTLLGTSPSYLECHPPEGAGADAVKTTVISLKWGQLYGISPTVSPPACCSHIPPIKKLDSPPSTNHFLPGWWS